MRFVETPIFTKVVTGLIGDDEYRSLQIALMLRPEQGPVIKGTGGLRKIRWAKPGTGKRGGFRLIYYWAPVENTFYTLYAYSKNEQGDLTPATLTGTRQGWRASSDDSFGKSSSEGFSVPGTREQHSPGWADTPGHTQAVAHGRVPSVRCQGRS